VLTGLNRAQRRQAARRCAEPLARSCLHTRNGRIVATRAGERAVRVLARAFGEMLRTGEPAVVQLSPAEALAFPGADPEGAQQAQSWLAVGIDVEGRGSYCLRHLHCGRSGLDRMTARRAVERLMLRELAEICGRAGLEGHPLPTAAWGAEA
jgi:hypothetical protein